MNADEMMQVDGDSDVPPKVLSFDELQSQ
jgi:hypothetical protein